jgi:hypothetical protein
MIYVIIILAVIICLDSVVTKSIDKMFDIPFFDEDEFKDSRKAGDNSSGKSSDEK